LYLTRRSENFWLQDLHSNGILYLRLNAVQATSGNEDLEAFGRRALSIMDGGGVERVIVDLRQNNGGNNQLIPGILDFLTDARINRDGSLIVFTDRHTFSAAGNLVAAIAEETVAQFVGVSPGGSGSQFGDAVRVDLPNSRIAAFIPSRHWIFGPSAFQPVMHPMDVIIEPAANDFLTGVDPLLELYTGG
jgi:C-terminal processing protease CtpA/Prc